MLMQTVDFVIPHMGRPELLLKTIESILAQSALAQIQKIVVVTKNTEMLVLPSHEKLHIVYCPEAKNISEQRNIGVRYGDADYLAFLDADIQLSANWLAKCLCLMTDDMHRVVVSAMQQAAVNAGAIERLRTVLSNTVVDQAVSFLPGRNLLVKRTVNEQVGGFPEHLQTCEDYYYTEKLSQIGMVYYTSETSYIHLGEDKTLKQTFEKEIWRSEYNLRSVSGRTIPLREWPSILLPFWMFAAIVQLVFGVFSPSLIFSSLVMLAIPILAYSVRLFSKAKHSISFSYIALFYTVYFAARTIGTIAGTRLLLKR